MKNNRKGFTIVELVIVIAVVAVLAAVLIPTFSAIIKRTNVSADTQAARNMNIILTAECADSSVPLTSLNVKELLEKNGVNNFSPQTRFYNFFWVANDNVIVLADEGDRPVYPEEYLDAPRTESWHALDVRESFDLPSRPEKEEGRDPRTFTVTVTQSGSSVIIPFENIPTQAREYGEFNVDIYLPVEFQEKPQRYAIQKVTAIMHDGEDEYKIELISEKAMKGLRSPFEPDEPAQLRIPDVTGNIEINIDVAEYCVITYNGTTYKDGETYRWSYNKLYSYVVDCESFSEVFLPEGYRVVSAIATTVDGVYLGELYDKETNYIVLVNENLTRDIVIEIKSEPITEPTE